MLLRTAHGWPERLCLSSACGWRNRVRVCAATLILAGFTVTSTTSGQETQQDLPNSPEAALVNPHKAAGIEVAQAKATAPSQGPPSSPAETSTSGSQTPQSLHERAQAQLKAEEKQRVLGVVPNFNTTSDQNAAPLSPGQKFQLAFASALDPVTVVVAGLDAAISQAQDAYPGYGQGAEGYSKRVGASYADTFDGTLWGNAIFPVLLHEDPRYFRRGQGSKKSRIWYAITTTVICKKDNGTWAPNYGNVLGNLTAGAISNLYYPSTDQGVGLTLERAFTVTAEGSLGAIFDEFWPDVAQRVFHRSQ